MKVTVKPTQSDRQGERVQVSFTCDKCQLYYGENVPLSQQSEAEERIKSQMLSHETNNDEV